MKSLRLLVMFAVSLLFAGFVVMQQARSQGGYDCGCGAATTSDTTSAGRFVRLSLSYNPNLGDCSLGLGGKGRRYGLPSLMTQPGCRPAGSPGGILKI